MRRLGPQLGSYDYNVVLRAAQRPARVFARELAMELGGLPKLTPAPSHRGAAQRAPSNREKKA